VLGLVGRDLLFDAVEAVAADNAKQAFDLTGRAVELGYDLRSVCRELSRVVRDLLLVSVDASRVNDPEIAGEGERDRIKALAAAFSREDLLRAFELLTKAETDIRTAAQPRYHLEMALLKWMYLRKLAPIEDLIAGVSGAPANRPAAPPSTPKTAAAPVALPAPAPASSSNLRDALLNEIRKTKVVFYNTIVAQAQKIDVAGDRVTFTFGPAHRSMREMFEKDRAQIEAMAQQVSGRKISIASIQVDAGGGASSADAAQPAKAAPKPDRKSALKEQALQDSSVQAMLEVFPAEIRDVEEM